MNKWKLKVTHVWDGGREGAGSGIEDAHTAGQQATARHPLIERHHSRGAVAVLSHCGSSRREELGVHSYGGCRQGLLLPLMLGFKTETPQQTQIQAVKMWMDGGF